VGPARAGGSQASASSFFRSTPHHRHGKLLCFAKTPAAARSCSICQMAAGFRCWVLHTAAALVAGRVAAECLIAAGGC
jgi:hypothetical protein